MVRRGWGEGSICRRVVRRGEREYVYWRVAIPLGSDASGRRLRKEFQSRSEKAARAFLRQAVARADRGLPPAGAGVTVGTYAQGWLNHRASLGLRPPTLDFYRASLLHFDQIAALPVAALAPAHVRDLIDARTAEGYASRTIRGVVQTLNLVLRQAMADGLVERNVAALVRLPQLVQKEPQHFTAEQARRFLDAAKGDDLYSLYAVGLATGLRRGELLGLTWADVRDDGRSLAVRRSKTAAGVRSVPLAGFGRAALQVDAGRHVGPIWSVSPSYASAHFRALCEKAKVPYITFHGLRHTAASLMLDAGVDPLVIQQIIGHTRVSMTAHYARSGEALQRDAIERLGKVVG